jgi:hypothetical protein
MIAYALELAAEGQKVLMVFNTSEEVWDTMRIVACNKHAGVDYANIKASTVSSAPTIRWGDVSLEGADVQGSEAYGFGLLVDHNVLYRRYEDVIDEYVKFDDPHIGDKHGRPQTYGMPDTPTPTPARGRRMRLR